tara:strand:+ start:101 stop:994 length:894 start_codon:yes stop_codon:yes gene_type:complete
MKCLVTGGAGFVGTNLIKRLLKDGHEVVSVDNYTTGKKEYERPGCTYYDFDLSSEHLLGLYVDQTTYPTWRDDDYDLIFHLAARARIQPSLENPYRTFQSNVIGTENILEYARVKDIPIVYAGSSSVHGDVYANPYTFTKWQGEELCKLYTKVFGLPTVICRFYNVYGEHQLTDGDYCCVLGIFERQYKDGRPLTITGDGEQRRDFTYVGDIVDGLIRCGENINEIGGEEFELGNGENYSINEVAEAFGANYPVKYIEARKGEIRNTLCRDENANELLGWNPRGNIVKFIEENYLNG